MFKVQYEIENGKIALFECFDLYIIQSKRSIHFTLFFIGKNRSLNMKHCETLSA